MKKTRPIIANSRQITRRKRPNNRLIVASFVMSGLLIGTIAIAVKSISWLGQLTNWSLSPNAHHLNQNNQGDGAIVQIMTQPSAQRASKLEELAKGEKSLNRERARYILASDLIANQQGKEALKWLEGLEENYQVLAPYILLKRAQAYEINGDNSQAEQSRQDLLKRYPTSPVAAAALFALGQKNPKNWDKAIAQFPSHPLSLEIIHQRLKQNPNQLPLLLILAKYAPETPEIMAVLDKIVSQYAQQLKPPDWETIAADYWKQKAYEKASTAYKKAPNTAFNAYRVAKGLELSGKKPQAANAYKYLIAEFPKAPESANGLISLANLSPSPEALIHLDQVISQFPAQAGDALIEKFKILEKQQNTTAATQAKQLLLTAYTTSDATAEYRWTMAQKQAAAKDFAGAIKWAEPIITQDPHSKFTFRASFWIGKWANQLGNQQQAKTAFENTLRNYPQSYYAWRSAVLLGWDVGDFSTVRQKNPEVIRPAERPNLAAGSATLKELYQIEQDQDAWTLWRGEFENRIQPTVEEQFTDGLLRLAIGKYLEGIAQVSKLEDRETPAEQAQYLTIKQQPAYWQALYPFPFLEDIENWSKQRQLNPLLVTALIRQESRFEPAIRSVVGAVGLMQMMPSTASWVAQKNNLTTYTLENPQQNIQLGTWYLDHTHQLYNNNSLLAVASYNAGAGNVSKWIAQKGLSDPDEFVEAIPFEETKNYVKNVFGNYWNYLRLYNPQVSEKVAKYSAK